nr:ThiF family adenylyltransferase [Lachnospiraceae bacterium]
MVPSRKEWTEALKLRHGEALYERFGAARVAVCGLGGLGSNIAIALIRAGVGRLLLIDYDRVDVTNLHRQQYKAGQVGELKTEALRE